MKKIVVFVFVVLFTIIGRAQTKVAGKVVDTRNEPVAFANVIFSNSSEGTVTDRDGEFELTSEKNYNKVEISFTGFQTKVVHLRKPETEGLEILLEEDVETLDAAQIYTGKTSKKNNPAIDILKKIWANKRHNGVNQYHQYQFDKYEKLEFDFNTIDSAMIKSKFFNGMEFIFKRMDTSVVSGKNYLPFFINEEASEVYGDNNIDKEKEILKGNRNSGFSDNEALTDFIKSLYSKYNIYDNYLEFFDKSFISPLSETGVNVYNYVLADSAYIDKKWSYKIVYYPRRENELTFKGDFWVNDTTWAIKDINLEMTKGANINWVNDVNIEQEYQVLNDSTFVITRDHFVANFALRKTEDAHGIYGKRTTLYDNYVFDEKKPKDFYKQKRTVLNNEVFNRGNQFWENHRIENLSDQEKGIYKMLDTLKTTSAFQRLHTIGSIIGTGYVRFGDFDYGPILTSLGYNRVEGLRLRAGGRTFFGPNDMWRIEGYGAVGLKDHKFKYGVQGKWMIEPYSRLKIIAGMRHDIEQLGTNFMEPNKILGRSSGSSSLLSISSVKTLSDIYLSTLDFEISPVENFKIRVGGSYRFIRAASPEFNLDYYTNPEHTQKASAVSQGELTTSLSYTPGRKTTNYGVERLTVNEGDYAKLRLAFTAGVKGLFDDDFSYQRLQFSYSQPIHIGGFGKMTPTLNVGKTFGAVPLALLNPVPGNQTLTKKNNTFPLLDYYEFVTDTYASLQLEHNFNGRIFSRIPLLRNWNLREIVGFRGVMGRISAENKALNASSSHPALFAPDDHPYWSWSVGVGNIFKLFRLDFHFRGNYFDNPEARKFGVTGTFHINF